MLRKITALAHHWHVTRGVLSDPRGIARVIKRASKEAKIAELLPQAIALAPMLRKYTARVRLTMTVSVLATDAAEAQDILDDLVDTVTYHRESPEIGVGSVDSVKADRILPDIERVARGGAKQQ